MGITRRKGRRTIPLRIVNWLYAKLRAYRKTGQGFTYEEYKQRWGYTTEPAARMAWTRALRHARKITLQDILILEAGGFPVPRVPKKALKLLGPIRKAVRKYRDLVELSEDLRKYDPELYREFLQRAARIPLHDQKRASKLTKEFEKRINHEILDELCGEGGE